MEKAARVVLLTLLHVLALQATDRPDFVVAPAVEPPKIDGGLEDAVWQNPPLTLGDWISYNPLRGEVSTFRTDVRVAYDGRYLYFSFHCFDPEPAKIRTTISRRDNVFNDDWIGLSLDSAATGQTSYHLLVNPSGIQMDALNTSSSGEKWEADLIWDSAGKLTGDGSNGPMTMLMRMRDMIPRIAQRPDAPPGGSSSAPRSRRSSTASAIRTSATRRCKA